MKKYLLFSTILLSSSMAQQVLLSNIGGNLYSDTINSDLITENSPPPRYQQDPKHTKGPILGPEKKVEEIDPLKGYDANSEDWFNNPISFETEGKDFLTQQQEHTSSRGGRPFFKDKAYKPKDKSQKTRMNSIACALYYLNIKIQSFEYDLPISDSRIVTFKRSQDARQEMLNKSYKENGPIKAEFDQFKSDCITFFENL